MSEAAARLIARALHAQADNCEREAHREAALAGISLPLTRKDVLELLAEHDRQLATVITSRVTSESGPQD